MPRTIPRTRNRLARQLFRFVAVGALCAVVDSACYWMLLRFGVWVHLAKALSFVAGTTTAFFLNRRFTFDAPNRGLPQAGAFAALYSVTFFVNVGVNALVLQLLPTIGWEYALAWASAQAVATLINFIVLRAAVFRG